MSFQPSVEDIVKGLEARESQVADFEVSSDVFYDFRGMPKLKLKPIRSQSKVQFIMATDGRFRTVRITDDLLDDRDFKEVFVTAWNGASFRGKNGYLTAPDQPPVFNFGEISSAGPTHGMLFDVRECTTWFSGFSVRDMMLKFPVERVEMVQGQGDGADEMVKITFKPVAAENEERRSVIRMSLTKRFAILSAVTERKLKTEANWNVSYSVENSNFAEIEGVWLPKNVDITAYFDADSPLGKIAFKKKAVLRDWDIAVAFGPEKFHVDFPDGLNIRDKTRD